MAVTWTTPKTNWTSTDHFNCVDYNRIKGNLTYLYEQMCAVIKTPKTFDDMGDDITENTKYWQPQYFNAWEANLESINAAMYQVQDLGTTLTFYYNNQFITYTELNRIESSCLSIYNLIESYKTGLWHIPFRLGNFKGFKN